MRLVIMTPYQLPSSAAQAAMVAASGSADAALAVVRFPPTDTLKLAPDGLPVTVMTLPTVVTLTVAPKAVIAAARPVAICDVVSDTNAVYFASAIMISSVVP